jgi:hypothetical protein
LQKIIDQLGRRTVHVQQGEKLFHLGAAGGFVGVRADREAQGESER